MDTLVGEEIFLFEDFRLDRRAGGLFRTDANGVLVPLAMGSRALDLLILLVKRHGDLVSKDEIMVAVWPGMIVEDSNLPTQILILRRILDRGRANGSFIQTVSGRGYRFVAPVARALAATILQPPVAPRLSIVVLPFANLSNDPDQQYFADGITEDLTTDLSRITDMFVIARNTAFTYRNNQPDPKQIGRELGVRYLFEGSVQRSGSQVRVNAQLIDAETNAHLWAERFDGDIGDLFALQDEITSRIAVALNLELVGAEAARPTHHPDALDYVLRARAASAKPSSRDQRIEVVSLLERALKLNPRSAEAQSWLSAALAGRVLANMTDSRAADIERARELSEQALATAPRGALAHFAKGQVLRAQRRFAEAIPEYETVLALDRNWVYAFFALGQCKLYTGSIEETIAFVEQAIRLSPRDPQLGSWYETIGLAYLLQSHAAEAIIWLEKARNHTPGHSIIRAQLASAYALAGDTEGAAAELAEARRLSPDDRYSSLARVRAVGIYGVPKIQALREATYLAGLRKAGMPEE
jgi:TolB-like protein/predicted TPR repeat methyltransferase